MSAPFDDVGAAAVCAFHDAGVADAAWSTAVGRGRPSWISAGGAELSVTVSGSPKREDIDSNINEQLIVELYSK